MGNSFRQYLLNFFIIFLKFLLKFIDKFLQVFKYKFFYLRVIDALKINYDTVFLKNKKINFYTPSYISAWRVSSLFTKEPETIEWIDNFQKNGDNNIVFWDIGANIGIYSIYAAKVHEKVSIYSHEPNFKNLSILAKNISLNNFNNKIFINQMPLGQDNFILGDFYEGNEIDGSADSSFKKSINSYSNNYKIIGTNINFLINKKICETPNYIKIDIDGLEDLVLNGAEQALSSQKLKSILIETDISNLSTYTSINKKLESYGFNLESMYMCNKNIYNLIYYK